MPNARPHLQFAAYAAGITALNAGVLERLGTLAINDATASHLVLVPFCTVALIYWRRDAIFASVQSDRTAAASWWLPVLAMLAWLGPRAGVAGSRGDALSVRVAMLAFGWFAGFLAAYGTSAFRAALFPLAFLLFMIPIPSVVLEPVTNCLKRGSTEGVAFLLGLTDTPFHQDGFVFDLPSFSIEIADECSGIRSSIALLLASLVAGHLWLNTRTAKALLLIAVLPIAIAKNAVRITALTLLALHVDPGFLTGNLHHEGGVIFFLLAVAMLAPIFVLLIRCDRSLLAGADLQ